MSMRLGGVAVVLAACLLAGGGSAVAYAEFGESDAYRETRLLFGTARPDGGEPVTDEEFRAFVGEFVTPRFPEGLTVQEGYGQWLDERGVIERERSYELVLYYPAREGGASDPEIEEIRREYLRRFGQESVARVDDLVSLGFQVS